MSKEYRTYVTTMHSDECSLFADMYDTIAKAKTKCLKMLLKRKLTKSEINTELQKDCEINKRLANSIITYVEGKVKSARECRSLHLEQLQGKLKEVKKVIESLEKKIKGHQKYLKAVEKARCFKLGIQLIEVNPAYSSLIGLIKFMSLYGLNSATAAALVLARRAMRLSERPPARTAYQGTEPRKHVWCNWRSTAKRVKGASRHSFYQPRLTAYPRLRTTRVISTDATSNGLWEVGESPTGSRHTAGRRVCE